MIIKVIRKTDEKLIEKTLSFGMRSNNSTGVNVVHVGLLQRLHVSDLIEGCLRAVTGVTGPALYREI